MLQQLNPVDLGDDCGARRLHISCHPPRIRKAIEGDREPEPPTVGRGNHLIRYSCAFSPELILINVQLLYAIGFLYVLALGLCRASAAFFISRMAHKGPQTLPAQVLAGISGVWTVASFCVIGIRGDIARPWSTLDGSQPLVLCPQLYAQCSSL